MRKLNFLTILLLVFVFASFCQQPAVKVSPQKIEDYELEFERLKMESLDTIDKLCKLELDLKEHKKHISEVKKDKTKTTKLKELIEAKATTEKELYILKCKEKREKKEYQCLLRQSAHKNALRQVEAALINKEAAGLKFEAVRLRFGKP